MTDPEQVEQSEIRYLAEKIGNRIVMGECTFRMWLICQAIAGSAIKSLTGDGIEIINIQAIAIADSTIRALAEDEYHSREEM